MVTEFGIILLFLIIGALFVGISIFAAALIRPHNPTPEKLTTYESGEEPIGSPWVQFNIRFYIIALAFLIFEVELVFLFPWAVVFKTLGWYAFIAMVVFVLILILGLAYDWAKGYLEWDKPKPYIPRLKDLIITREDLKKQK
ncbi:MAG TPA: NADH-quinone oxidoreductase subunit A [Candidatus Kapabacteria bacterium]|jgi:NADH-quinone oxidoreductase subunit A|nr:NADH-quinone oxidoreductase subunit A [Candidatus Kapabacteria bacterium]HOM04274.1 NADH-quinone oxidoreductase subunit A [Candidatus Kapabacteria bacterium]HPP38774.1 NADH-quinone oxidoreductase subunit A [Candidatus Kapabacteria bacterium]HPU23184.1 NADH-quinone oxidoreductase subunit A [Candidatus Kapabacteria bacterium]